MLYFCRDSIFAVNMLLGTDKQTDTTMQHAFFQVKKWFTYALLTCLFFSSHVFQVSPSNLNLARMGWLVDPFQMASMQQSKQIFTMNFVINVGQKRASLKRPFYEIYREMILNVFIFS